MLNRFFKTCAQLCRYHLDKSNKILHGALNKRRIWCSGIIVPSHGTDRGSIPRMRRFLCSLVWFCSSKFLYDSSRTSPFCVVLHSFLLYTFVQASFCSLSRVLRPVLPWTNTWSGPDDWRNPSWTTTEILNRSSNLSWRIFHYPRKNRSTMQLDNPDNLIHTSATRTIVYSIHHLI